MIADSVVATILQAEADPYSVNVKSKAVRDDEQIHILEDLLNKYFGGAKYDPQTQQITINFDGDIAKLHVPTKTLECENTALRHRIQTTLSRLELSRKDSKLQINKENFI